MGLAILNMKFLENCRQSRLQHHLQIDEHERTVEFDMTIGKVGK
jgi:hypothetical protein